MGAVTAIFGLLIGGFFVSAVSFGPIEEPAEQTVQALYYVASILGFVLFALGLIAHRLKAPRTPAAPEAPAGP